MGVLAHVLVHTANKLSRTDDTDDAVAEGEEDELIAEGEMDAPTVEGPDFDCLLQLPQSTSQRPYGRQLKEPAILFEPEDSTGALIELADEDKLLIDAPELPGPQPAVWEVVGDPEPLAPPGQVIGFQARLRRVEDP